MRRGGRQVAAPTGLAQKCGRRGGYYPPAPNPLSLAAFDSSPRVGTKSAMLCFSLQEKPSPAPLFLLFRKKARLLRLCPCKRRHNASASLPLFCGAYFTWSLPLWGRWHGFAVTERARWSAPTLSKVYSKKYKIVKQMSIFL